MLVLANLFLVLSIKVSRPSNLLFPFNFFPHKQLTIPIRTATLPARKKSLKMAAAAGAGGPVRPAVGRRDIVRRGVWRYLLPLPKYLPCHLQPNSRDRSHKRHPTRKKVKDFENAKYCDLKFHSALNVQCFVVPTLRHFTSNIGEAGSQLEIRRRGEYKKLEP